MSSSWRDKWRKLKPKPGPKLRFDEAQKASLSAVSSKPQLATGHEVGLENSLEVCDLPVSHARWLMAETRNRLRNIKSKLAEASGTGRTTIFATRKRNLSKLLRRY